MKVILNGARGKMGSEVWKMLEEGKRGMEIAAGIDPTADGSDARILKNLSDYKGDADVIIDFSNHVCTKALMEYAVSRGLPCVVATTGQVAAELELIHAAAEKIPVFLSANMSLGVALLADFARRAAALLPDADIEIVEKHHNTKLDAPSGTALMLANEIKKSREDACFVCGRYGHQLRAKNEIGIHALRMGGVIGEHEVILASGTETISLKHEAHSRTLFADGALSAAEFLIGKPAGLYDMHALVGGATSAVG
ncbi:MAG: 4-hydroxy-tetrahydrodipicolinate reductase [Clostridiales bacterium]|nr:4-hydroxy-tetrahydrodipicolinate reductase [Clostridiales bacterium]